MCIQLKSLAKTVFVKLIESEGCFLTGKAWVGVITTKKLEHSGHVRYVV